MLGGGDAKVTLIALSEVTDVSETGMSVGLLGTLDKITVWTSDIDDLPAIFSAWIWILKIVPGAAEPKLVIKSYDKEGLFLTSGSLTTFTSVSMSEDAPSSRNTE